jgi:lauroyl/myristoyl acyltransferase
VLPEASRADLEQMCERRRRFAGHEEAAMRRLQAGDTALLQSGHRFLADAPELAGGGIVLTMHLGPYQFLPEPFLAAGIRPVVLLDVRAQARLRPPAEQMIDRLRLPAEPEWVVATDPGAVRSLVKAARARRPIIAFLDGNAGAGGYAETRRNGISYRLPGREIRVRTGLARLACRLECAVHPVVVRWTAAGEVSWSRSASLRFARHADPTAVTRELLDWGFGEVITTPEQWFFWEVVKESAACFAPGVRRSGGIPAGLRDDYARAFSICLERAPGNVRIHPVHRAEVWSDAILVDLDADRFYAADGLRARDLSELELERPSLAELVDRHGEPWVRRHALRLCLLGIARLGGEGDG